MVTFNASASSDDGTIAEYVWAFGDGHTVQSLEPYVTHNYHEGGHFRVSLTVRDDGSLASNAGATLSIFGDLYHETVAKDSQSAWETPDIFTIRSNERWAEVWQHTFDTNSPPPVTPPMTFSSRTVIAALMGLRPNTGHSVSIRNVSFTDHGLEIRVDFSQTRYGGTAVTYPFHLVTVNGTWERAMYRVDHWLRHSVIENLTFSTEDSEYDMGATVGIFLWNGLSINATLPCELPWIVYRSVNDSRVQVESHACDEPEVVLHPRGSHSWSWKALSRSGYPPLEPGFYQVDLRLGYLATVRHFQAFFWLR